MAAITTDGRTIPASVALESSGGGSCSLSPATTQTLQPVPIPTANAPPPPFLVKTYEMVDDPSTDKIVSWSSTNNSFVVWDQPEFTRNLLPKYFKHNNYSSFVRQLNTYGFRKVDPDRQEFANEGFLRGQKHLLKTINRRKGAQGHVQPQPPPPPPQQQPPGENISAGPCIEVGKFGLEEEVERLKRDKNVLMQELVRLHQQQQATDNQLQTMVQHLQGMEQRQQQMMSFLAKAVNSPGFLAQFVQQQKNDSSNRRITERSKKRRLKQEDNGPVDQTVGAVCDGQIVKYQPMINEAAKAMLRQLVKLDPSPRLDNFSNTCDNDFMINNGSGSNLVSAVSLHDIPPTSEQSPISVQNSPTETPDIQPPPLFGGLMPEISDINPHIGAQNIQISQLPGISPEQENGAFIDTSSSDVNGRLTVDSDDLGYDNQIDWESTLLDIESMVDLPGSIDPFWEKFLKSPNHGFDTEEIDSPVLENLSKDGVDMELQVNGWDKAQHLEQLTTQMRNLV